MMPRDERPPARKEAAPATPGANVIRKVRSEHGTRVARSVVCSRCGAKDMIHFAPKDAGRVYCRKCAADVLGVEDPDTRLRSPINYACVICRRTELIQWKLPEGVAHTCADCKNGIESRQGDRSKTATRLSKQVVRVRRKEEGEK